MTEAACGLESETTGEDERVEGDDAAVDRSHLEVEDGCGCAEVWEHLSAQRGADGSQTDATDRDDGEAGNGDRPRSR